jgi:hypothetical protein
MISFEQSLFLGLCLIIVILLYNKFNEGFFNPMIPTEYHITSNGHELFVNEVVQSHLNIRTGQYYKFTFNTETPVVFSDMSCNSLNNQYENENEGNLFSMYPRTSGTFEFYVDSNVPNRFYLQADRFNRILITKI